MFDDVIVGAGPAGTDCALMLAEAGKSVALIEAHQPGGVCLNSGCIPTKSFLFHANQVKTLRKLGLSPESIKSLQLRSIQETTNRLIKRSQLALKHQLEQSGVTLLQDRATAFDASCVTLSSQDKICFKNLILATGTEPWVPPAFEKVSSHPRLFTNNTIFSMDTLPSQIIIIGGGAIGVEFAFFFSLMGTSVTLYEAAPSILPQLDTDLAQAVRRQLKLQKVSIFENTSIETVSDELMLTLSTGKTAPCDSLLLATGRRAVTFPTDISLERSPQGFLQVNDFYQTSHPNIFAIGDLNGKSLLAHSATAQAKALASWLTTGNLSSLSSIPFVVYSTPTAASVGLRSQDIEGNPNYNTKIVSMNLLGKAQIEGYSDGWLKLITDSSGTLAGCHIWGPHSEDMISLFSLAIDERIALSSLAKQIFPHPSYIELLGIALDQVLSS